MINSYKVEVDTEAQHLSYKSETTMRRKNFQKIVSAKKALLLNSNNKKKAKNEKQKRQDLILSYFAKKALSINEKDGINENSQLGQQEVKLNEIQKYSVMLFLEKRLNKLLPGSFISLSNEVLGPTDLHLICNAIQDCFNKLESLNKQNVFERKISEQNKDDFAILNIGASLSEVGTDSLSNRAEVGDTLQPQHRLVHNSSLPIEGSQQIRPNLFEYPVGLMLSTSTEVVEKLSPKRAEILDDVVLLLGLLCDSVWEVKIEEVNKKYSTFELLSAHGFSKNQIKERLQMSDAFIDSYCAFNWCSGLPLLSKRLGNGFGTREIDFLENLLSNNSKLTGKLIEAKLIVLNYYEEVVHVFMDSMGKSNGWEDVNGSNLLRINAKESFILKECALGMSIEDIKLVNHNPEEIKKSLGANKYDHLPRMAELWLFNLKSLERLSNHKEILKIIDEYVDVEDLNRLKRYKNTNSEYLSLKYCKVLLKSHVFFDQWQFLLNMLKKIKDQQLNLKTESGTGQDQQNIASIVNPKCPKAEKTLHVLTDKESELLIEIERLLNKGKINNIKQFKKMVMSLNLKEQEIYRHRFDFELQDEVNAIRKSFLLSMLSTPMIMVFMEKGALKIDDELVDFLLMNKKFSKKELYMITEAAKEERVFYFEEQMRLMATSDNIDYFIEHFLPNIKSFLERQELEKNLVFEKTKIDKESILKTKKAGL